MSPDMDEEDVPCSFKECEMCNGRFRPGALRTVRDQCPDEPGSYSDLLLCPECYAKFKAGA